MFKVFLNSYERHCQRNLKDNLQLTILRTLICLRADSFLVKYHETKKWAEKPG